MVDCTGEGVLFIEADADVRLEQFGDALQPPFPFLKELLYDVPGSDGILHCPLLLIQVTRLTCGGFIFAFRLNHTMSDAEGLSQFLSAVGEIARGAEIPSIPPVWCREHLTARSPPRVTCIHHEYDQDTMIPDDKLVHRSFFFGPTEISTLRKYVQSHLANCTTIELLSASLWRCRILALQPNPNDQMRMILVVDARSKFKPPLPFGYYGNVLATPVASSTAQELSENPLEYAVELVKKAKSFVTDEYMRSFLDLMEIKGKLTPTIVTSYAISDVTRARFSDVNFGWGTAVYGGPASMGPLPGFCSFYLPSKNGKGENGIAVPICLPTLAMERFVVEMEKLLQHTPPPS